MEFQKDVFEKNYGIDGEPTEFEWIIFPVLTSLELLRKIQEYLGRRNIVPEKFGDRIIFMSMFNDTIWDKKNNDQECISNSEAVTNYAKKFLPEHWTFIGLGSEERSMTLTCQNPEEKWNSVAGEMLPRFVETGHPVFTGSSSLSRRVVQRKNNRNTMHFSAFRSKSAQEWTAQSWRG